MNRVHTLLASLLVLTLLFACATPAPVERQFDWQADFAKYQTWQWLDKKPVVVDALVGDDPLDRSIRRAVDRELGLKGLRSVADKPDLLVKYSGVVQAAVSATPGTTGYSNNWRWSRSSAGGWQSDSYRKGTLTIDLIDAETRQLVWRGSASAPVGDERDVQSKIPTAVKKILAEYPPKR